MTFTSDLLQQQMMERYCALSGIGRSKALDEMWDTGVLEPEEGRSANASLADLASAASSSYFYLRHKRAIGYFGIVVYFHFRKVP